jgi:hypothetical protein
MNERDLARWLAAGRIVLGGALLAAPTVTAGPWFGRRSAGRPAVRVLARSLGARDLALGLGLLAAVEGGASARRWLGAGVLADATDFAATLGAGDVLPGAGRKLVLGMAGSATLAGLGLAAALD